LFQSSINVPSLDLLRHVPLHYDHWPCPLPMASTASNFGNPTTDCDSHVIAWFFCALARIIRHGLHQPPPVPSLITGRCTYQPLIPVFFRISIRLFINMFNDIHLLHDIQQKQDGFFFLPLSSVEFYVLGFSPTLPLNLSFSPGSLAFQSCHGEQQPWFK
jgi:hypothetical protein